MQFPLSHRCSRSWLSTLLVLALSGMTAVSCGWVDSTGNSDNDANADVVGLNTSNDSSGGQSDENGQDQNNQGNGSENQQADPNIAADLSDRRLVRFLEDSSVRVTPSNVFADPVSWTWTSLPPDEGIADCGALDGFDNNFSTTSINAACSADTECTIGISETPGDGNFPSFDITMPELRAPLALSYRLTSTDSDGNQFDEHYLFCGISINEAPIARNDIFTVVRGNTLVVRANDPITLLSNDIDDDDIRNQPLRVLPVPAREPRFAQNFRLQTNGGFLYTAPVATPQQASITDFDSFGYILSDGLHDTQATVTLRIVNSNNAPLLVARISTIVIFVNEPLAFNDPAYDLGRFFRDPDGNPLQFATVPGSLPGSGNLTIDTQGRLSGTALAGDTGDFNVTVIASDGSLSATETFVLSIRPNPATSNNSLPVILPIDDIVIEQGDRIDLFIDAFDNDGDDLQFGLSDDSAFFLTINRNTGRLRGRATETGIFPVTVIVSDNTSSSTRTFLVRVIAEGNLAPQVDDISNVIFDEPFNYNVSSFFIDPENDSLFFSAINLPAGITISSDGIISGAPASANLGSHFIVVTASDGFNSTDDGFLLTLQ